ncbi:MAG: glyceraldehyde-3-phosphate dehydrogenase, partial [Pseudomonadota bacterium]
FTTIHDVTNTQTMVDRPHKDPRRARSAITNLIPTTTGSATAIMQIFPDLEGRLTGHAVRVPLLNASLTDCAFEMERVVTEDEVHAAFRAAEAGPMAGILGVEDRPLVSSDYRGDRRSVVVDSLSTRVIQGTHLKLYTWYDNEFGYAMRLVDIARMVAA